LVACTRCYMATREPTEHKGETLCPSCLIEVQRKPVKVKTEPSAPQVTTTIIKPKETWEHRKATMTQPVSKMDEAMLLRLQENPVIRELGFTVTFQKHYCITEIISDVTLEKDGDEIACFFDGEAVHRNRQERDEANRQKAADRHHIKVLSLTYSSFTEKEAQRLLQQVLATIENK